MNSFSCISFSFSYLRKSALICGCFFLLAATTAMAQHGGKAEPNRIVFKRGATSTTFNGTVRGDEKLSTCWRPGKVSG